MEDDKKDQKSDDKKDDKKEAPIKAADDIQALRDRIAALEKEKADAAASNLSLNDKVRLDRDARDKKDSDTKNLESALTFNLTSQDFLKSNESLLPKEIGEIFKTAQNEKYESAIERANATKSAIIQSFFSQQSNVDLLTESQKSTLSDYLKLTKAGKEEKAKDLYDNIFEPALSTLKRVKKAEELGRSRFGYKDASKGDSQYKEKLMQGSRKHFLGEKS
jgi:hypothetical protein